MTLGCKLNINLELRKTFFQEFLQSKIENDSVRTLIEACGNRNFVQIEDHMKWTHFHCRQMRHSEFNTQSWRNFIQVDCNNHAWIWWLHIFCLKHLRIKTQSWGNLIQVGFNNRNWIWWLPIFCLLRKGRTNNLKNSDKCKSLKID